MMLEGSGKSDLWSKSIINSVPKKGDPSEPQKYRGIALIPTAAKIYNRVLLNRIQPHLESLLRTNKNGSDQEDQQSLRYLLFEDLLKT